MGFRLGLTGSIATGKSTALAAFAALGAATISADETVHALYEAEAVESVEAAFPGTVVDGHVDRQRLAGHLVAAPERIADLEAIVHPLVRRRLMDFVLRAKSDLVVLDIPLLFESGHDYGLDAVAVTICSPEEQRRRALDRPGMTVEKLEAILARQMKQDEKIARADFVIDTDGSLDATRAQVADIVAECRRRAEQGDWS